MTKEDEEEELKHRLQKLHGSIEEIQKTVTMLKEHNEHRNGGEWATRATASLLKMKKKYESIENDADYNTMYTTHD